MPTHRHPEVSPGLCVLLLSQTVTCLSRARARAVAFAGPLRAGWGPGAHLRGPVQGYGAHEHRWGAHGPGICPSPCSSSDPSWSPFPLSVCGRPGLSSQENAHSSPVGMPSVVHADPGALPAPFPGSAHRYSRTQDRGRVALSSREHCDM